MPHDGDTLITARQMKPDPLDRALLDKTNKSVTKTESDTYSEEYSCYLWLIIQEISITPSPGLGLV